MKILIYTDRPSPALSIDALSRRLEEFDLELIFRGNLIESLKLSEQEETNLAGRTSGAIIQDINVPKDDIGVPSDRSVYLERKRITGELDYMGVFYDGYWLQRIFYTLLREKLTGKKTDDFGHIIFTGRLFGTFERRRYHARVILMGIPNLISTSGVVEAPARPREYYWLKAGFIHSGKDIAELDSIFKERFIEYNDSRMTSVLGSYALQAVAHEASGIEFCDDKTCCLYNSHWQEEVLSAQLDGKLCREHHDVMSGVSFIHRPLIRKKD